MYILAKFSHQNAILAISIIWKDGKQKINHKEGYLKTVEPPKLFNKILSYLAI